MTSGKVTICGTNPTIPIVSPSRNQNVPNACPGTVAVNNYTTPGWIPQTDINVAIKNLGPDLTIFAVL